MSNPTTPFNWQMPTNTDLVTDLPADFEVFGQAVATSMADLLGGTSGQILSKNSNTDMDFVWVDNQVGDITSITATSPLTGGGTGGDVTVGIQASSTTQSGAVQLTDSTSSTSTTTAATPNSVKSAYDAATSAQTTANAAIPKSTVTTSGDVIYATGSSAVTRLGIGSTGQVLTVSGGVPSWATPTASASGMKFINSTSFTTQSSVTVDSVFSSTYDYYEIILSTTGSVADDLAMQFRTGGVTNTNSNYYTQELQADSTTVSGSRQGPVTTGVRVGKNNTVRCYSTIFLQNPYASLPTGVQSLILNNAEGLPNLRYHVGNFSATTSFDGFRLLPNSGTISGIVTVFGMAKS